MEDLAAVRGGRRAGDVYGRRAACIPDDNGKKK
ncbi:hypothetical protein SAMN05421806_107277 [Streptomyces indicus]|uniref:Uncharacterized protein n=1 Tax=Streptomyces indicus TaxID=417292 RepID=A0A1G9BW73_9ACTN|nr:hypothetical protein SAMN05421806_107277 [Streptomyces indicus]